MATTGNYSLVSPRPTLEQLRTRRKLQAMGPIEDFLKNGGYPDDGADMKFNFTPTNSRIDQASAASEAPGESTGD